MSLSCSVNQATLFKDSNIQRYFDPDEINDLANVLNAFDKIMVGARRLDEATLSNYHDRVKWTIDQAVNDGSCCEFLISPSLTIEILNSIPERTFSKLFKIWRVSDNDRIKLYFWPRTIDKESEYGQFISEITNPGINLYIHNILAAGDVNFNLTHQFYPQIDLNDERQRLLMAIDFISFTAQNHLDKDILIGIALKKHSLEEVQH